VFIGLVSERRADGVRVGILVTKDIDGFGHDRM
jgi:hypothetical protein